MRRNDVLELPNSPGHYFELMDRASVALDYCCEFIGSHQVTRRNKTPRALSRFSAYQGEISSGPARKGSTTRTPSRSWPWERSSVSRWRQPAIWAAETIRASHQERE